MSLSLVEYDSTSGEEHEHSDVECEAAQNGAESFVDLSSADSEGNSSSDAESSAESDEGCSAESDEGCSASEGNSSGVAESSAESDAPVSSESDEIQTPAKRRKRFKFPDSSDSAGESVENVGPESGGNPGGGQKTAKASYALKKDELSDELGKFLSEIRSFYTKRQSLVRTEQSVSDNTMNKVLQRILGFLGCARRKFADDAAMTTAVFERADLVEDYLDFLRDERKLHPSTVSSHASSMVYPLKFIHREKAPLYTGVPLIAQLRRTATHLAREGHVKRPKTREELQALNKWLDWDEVLEALKLQKSRFQLARGDLPRAREAADLLLLSFYCLLPPSRGLEIRTLQVVEEKSLKKPFLVADFKGKNVVLLKITGAVTLHLQLYKTHRYYGDDMVPLEADSQLALLINRYVSEFRPLLHCAEKSGDTLFLSPRSGRRHCSGSFSKHLQRMMMRLTGREVSVNVLRSSFLTWAYGQPNCDDRMKDSLACALRHTRSQAERVYDRRTAGERKSLARDMARHKAERETGAVEEL